PTFSLLQKQRARTNHLLLQVTSGLVLIGMPTIMFVCFCGRSMLTLLFGSRYGSAAGPLIAASFVALFNAVNGQVTTIYYARGLPQLHRRCVVIMAAMMIVLTYPFAVWFGFVGG